MRSESPAWPVTASATATQLESRGQEYSQRLCQPAITAPSGRVDRRRSSSARVARDVSCGLSPGTIPEESHCRSARIAACWQAVAGVVSSTLLEAK